MSDTPEMITLPLGVALAWRHGQRGTTWYSATSDLVEAIDAATWKSEPTVGVPVNAADHPHPTDSKWFLYWNDTVGAWEKVRGSNRLAFVVWWMPAPMAPPPGEGGTTQ